eukprot:2023721-Rhodomonas_salina.1
MHYTSRLSNALCSHSFARRACGRATRARLGRVGAWARRGEGRCGQRAVRCCVCEGLGRCRSGGGGAGCQCLGGRRR